MTGAASTNELLREGIARVVRQDNCTGCGGCALLSPHIKMQLDAAGYSRPVWSGDQGDTGRRTFGTQESARQAKRTFERICPGRSVTAPPSKGVREHPTMGIYVSVWSAWASDPNIRSAGSSGGVLTALSAWLLESGRATSVVGAGSSPKSPARTIPLVLGTREGVMSAAGSRYAPVSNLEVWKGDDTTALVGKPCEVDAGRRLQMNRATGIEPGLLLSFFCAGVSSQHVTDELVANLGFEMSDVAALRYRGNGWPGDFSVTSASGRTGRMSYEESWGEHLGRRLQERCKICPDGTGGHADIAIGDYWEIDDRGFPRFDDAAGVSVAIARTRRGHLALMEAREEGVLELAPLELDKVAAIQPLQTRRRFTLLARLVGRRFARRSIPRIRGYGMLRFALLRPRESMRVAKGSYQRARRA